LNIKVEMGSTTESFGEKRGEGRSASAGGRIASKRTLLLERRGKTAVALDEGTGEKV